MIIFDGFRDEPVFWDETIWESGVAILDSGETEDGLPVEVVR